MRYFKDFIIEVIVPLLLVLAFVAMVVIVIGSFMNIIHKQSCFAYQEVTGKQTLFHFGDCYIKTPDGWQSFEEYKTRAIASEGLKK